MAAPDPIADAKFEADLARLRAAKGIQFRAWFRENRRFAIGMLAYITLIAGVTTWAYIAHKDVVLWAAFAIFWLPVVFMRMLIRASYCRR